jgi:hypothetical protein
MSSYVIYLPGVQGANPQHLDKVGLGGLCADGAPEFADILDGGPDRGSGLLAAWRTGNTATDPSFSVADFKWVPAKACKARGLAAKRFYFGVDPQRPVTPKCIERKNRSLGYNIDLRDGHSWHIPAAMKLPHTHGLNDDGEFDRQVAEEYREYWQASEQYAVQFFKAIDQLDFLKQQRPKTDTTLAVDFTLANAWEFACLSLAINYRVTPEIVDMLKLLDDVGMRNIIKAAIDLPVIFEVRGQKKTDDLSIPVG